MSDAEDPDMQLRRIVQSALEEDVGGGDITTSSCIGTTCTARAVVTAKQELVTAGYKPFLTTFKLISDAVTCRFYVEEGSVVEQGQTIAEINGLFHVLLTGERTALNFLQHLSGIATLTRRFVDRVQHCKATILDTRKTIPGLRVLEKEAVRRGGGRNHRMGLYDAVLIKDNHIACCGGVVQAVRAAKKATQASVQVEVEVTSLEQLNDAISAGPDVIMLDNMTHGEIRNAVRLANGRVPLEASGTITLESVEDVAATGVDYISVGALTHSAPAADISMTISTCDARIDVAEPGGEH